MISWSKLLMASVFSIFLFQVPLLFVNSSSEDVTTLALTQAEEALATAHEAVLEAEEAGANVSILLDSLNLGAGYLAEAHVWYRLGVFDNVSSFCSLCVEVVEDVRSEAFGLRDEAHEWCVSDFIVRLIWSFVGVVIVVVVGFLVWRVFRRGYMRQVLGLRPEVVSGES